jgi:hypothetical protein
LRAPPDAGFAVDLFPDGAVRAAWTGFFAATALPFRSAGFDAAAVAAADSPTAAHKTIGKIHPAHLASTTTV